LYIQFDCAAVKRARDIAPVEPHRLFESLIQAEPAAAAWQRFFLKRPYSCDVALTASQIVATTLELQEQ
jgi:hypothetical protein